MIDSTTAGMLLSSVNSNNVDKVADVYKIVSKEVGGPSKEAIAFFEANKGKTCKVLYTNHIGIIHGLNTSTAGFYPGSRYPIYVKITSASAEGSIFEYELNQLEIITE